MVKSEYLDVNELSKIIHRTPGAIRNLILRRRIPFRKPGGRLMFLRHEIEQWIDSAPGLTVDELRKEE